MGSIFKTTLLFTALFLLALPSLGNQTALAEVPTESEMLLAKIRSIYNTRAKRKLCWNDSIFELREFLEDKLAIEKILSSGKLTKKDKDQFLTESNFKPLKFTFSRAIHFPRSSTEIKDADQTYFRHTKVFTRKQVLFVFTTAGLPIELHEDTKFRVVSMDYSADVRRLTRHKIAFNFESLVTHRWSKDVVGFTFSYRTPYKRTVIAGDFVSDLFGNGIYVSGLLNSVLECEESASATIESPKD